MASPSPSPSPSPSDDCSCSEAETVPRNQPPIFDDYDGHVPSNEVSPLLGNTVTRRYDGVATGAASTDASSTTKATAANPVKTKSTRSSLPSLIAIITLGLVSALIMVGVFILPHNVEAYVKQAVVLEPTNLAIESVTSNGVRARIQGTFQLDSRRVTEDTARKVGSLATWAVHSLGTAETRLDLYHAVGGNMNAQQHLGSLTVPPLAINLVDGHVTTLDFVTDLVPGSAEVFRSLANQWLDGQLGSITVVGKANLTVNSGVIPLGTHAVSEALTIEAGNVPAMPEYNISSMNFHDVPDGPGKFAVSADVAVTTYNKHPIRVNIPSLAFDVLIPDCNPLDPQLTVARATTDALTVTPKSNVTASAHAVVRRIPKSITRVCPKTSISPLDEFIKRYMKGEDATLFVRGSQKPSKDTPEWISTILSELTLAVPFPGHSFDSLIKEFSLTDVSFALPDPFADPDTPDADPKVSGSIHVVAALPKHLNVDIGVSSIRASADVLHEGRRFGKLHIDQWHAANSSKVVNQPSGDMSLEIDSRIENAPLTIVDSDVFSDVVQRLLFGDSDINLDVDALVDVKVNTSLGELVLKDVPASGNIPAAISFFGLFLLSYITSAAFCSTVRLIIPRCSGPGDTALPERLADFGASADLSDGGSLQDGLQPQIDQLRIVESTPSSMTFSALVNITNPTPYAATIPYVNIQFFKNDSLLGDATLRNVNVSTGQNYNIAVKATWAPSHAGPDARKVGVDLLSQYVSGFNSTMTLRMHEKSVPACPILGRSLSNINITAAIPKLSAPGDHRHHDADGNTPVFIRDATFHLFTSTASFTLLSPLAYDTIYLCSVNATAFWNHTERVGEILYDYPFAAPPGTSTTPRLPVDWSVGSVGYDKVLGALGGQLKLDARANVTVKVGVYEETIWYVGQGIGASVRL
ncbi:hypothetical protein TD95_001687 [Thielaviopsis punctulata]|uniref:Late embryogenesis abundant protein LEA-2 subgroup domain-containing protein n=1 Tax=Thielaviopsis punctulata TaxID=72032 RepID=A0A0F4ZHG1_9PEZI|nr:hypothetical protein TD95_001687 [Thielaviopsis punctulata]